ncbi:hypothetical protein EC991_006095 [Linnemannia zychae]|nr:hypothetical protein EC991_006095 [Linnemannia zychae]
MSTSAAKKKPRTQASSTTGETAGYQDSFQGMVTDLSDAKPGPRKTSTKKTTGSSPPRATESDTQQQQQQQQQQQRDFKFVVEGQDKTKTAKPVAFEVLPPFQAKSPAQVQSPSQDTPGEEALEQDAPESSPTPDFERNADGKFRCSWPRCGKEFTVASRLTTHFRIHSGKPPYLCGYKDCQKAFHTSSSLSHHRVVHTDQGLRPYICRHNRCGATYTQLARLITHQRTTHSGMILFIPQESSSSTSSPQTQSQAASATTTPSGNTPDDPFTSSPSQTPVPSGHESTPVPVSAAGLSLESNSSTPRPSTPVGLHDSNRSSGEMYVEDKDRDKDRDKGKSSKKEKGVSIPRTHTAAASQAMTPSKRPMVEQQQQEQQQRSHTASPTPRITPVPSSTQASGNNDHASTSGDIRAVSSTGYHSDDSLANKGGYHSAQENRQELNASDDVEDVDDETDEMRMRREAALTMASFKDVVRVEQPPQHQQQQASSGPPPTPSLGYYPPQRQLHNQHGGHSYSNSNNSDYGQSSHMYPPPPPPPAGHHHISFSPPAQQQQQVSNKYWNDDNGRGGPALTGPPPPSSPQSTEANKTGNNNGYHQHPPTSSPSSTPSLSRAMAMNSSSSSMNQHSQRRIGNASPFDALYTAASGGSKPYFGQTNDLNDGDPRNMFHEERQGSSGIYHSHPLQRGPLGPTPQSHYSGQR